MSIRLEVRTEERKWVYCPEGFYSSDGKKIDLMNFCSRYNLPYSCEFVSVWILPGGLGRTKQPGAPRRVSIARNADSYGREIILLGDHVVDCLALVACGDFQNTIMKAVELERSGKNVKSYLEKNLFIFTPEMSRVERIAKLERASAAARCQSRLGDAEGRLFRRLRNSDLQGNSASSSGNCQDHFA